MTTYFPIELEASGASEPCDLVGFDWQKKCADFALSNDSDRLLRISFQGDDIIVRMFDEALFALERGAEVDPGFVFGHFAYRVEGDWFAFRSAEQVNPFGRAMNHYRFLTDWGCLDVLAADEPNFEVISAYPYDRNGSKADIQ